MSGTTKRLQLLGKFPSGGSDTPGGSTVSLYNVTLTPDGNGNYASDKTVDEIVTAHNAGNIVRCNYTVDDNITATASVVQVLTVGGANCVLCSGVTSEGELAWIFIEPDGVTFVPYSGSGGTGKDGDSAYEIALKYGFEGTEEEWLESLKGPGAEVFYVTVSGTTDNFTADKTFAEITEAYNSGKSIAAKLNFSDLASRFKSAVAQLTHAMVDRVYIFCVTVPPYNLILSVYSDGRVTYNVKDGKTAAPYALTFTGAVTASYDGSKDVTIEIPEANNSDTGSTSSYPGKSVTSFGAVGDGVTDDTEAIQAALNEGGDIYFPAGRYKVTKQLTATKPCTISMFKQYPSRYLHDHPKTDEDNWMGARIETYSSTNGIVIGGAVNLDGFYIRAMAGFGSAVTASKYGGKGIVIQYDDYAVEFRTYPSSTRLRHIRIDIAETVNTVIPECLFDFKPNASYHYIIEDVILGQHTMKFCDYAFRADLANTPSKWAHNVFIRNMCIDSHCDYGVYATGDASGWMFEGLTIQGYGYVPKSVNAANSQDRPGHRALIKIDKLKDVGFYSCYLWDTGGTGDYPAQYSDGGEIVVDGTAKSAEIKSGTAIISCVGCSSHFDLCETYIHKKLNAPENLNIKDLEMSVTTNEQTGANVLALSDGAYTRTVNIPAATISEEQINSSVTNWLEDAMVPQKSVGRNKFDATRNMESGATKVNDDFNVPGFFYSNGGYDDSSMWTTHLIPAEYGDVLRFSKDSIGMQGFAIYCFDAELNMLGKYGIASGDSGQPEAIDYNKPHVAIKNTAFVRITFDRTQSKITGICYPTDEGAKNLCITINDSDVSYEPYTEKFEAKLGMTLPTVSESDNGKILKVVNGAWAVVDA